MNSNISSKTISLQQISAIEKRNYMLAPRASLSQLLPEASVSALSFLLPPPSESLFMASQAINPLTFSLLEIPSSTHVSFDSSEAPNPLQSTAGFVFMDSARLRLG